METCQKGASLMSKIIFVLMLFISPHVAFGDTLSLEKFIELAKKHDPQFKVIFSDEEKLKYLKDQALPSDSTIFSLSKEYGVSSDDKANTSEFTGRLSQDISQTGTQFSVSHSNAIRPDREENVTKLRIEQSLYKNMFGRDVRLLMKTLGYEEELVRLQILGNYQEYLLNLFNNYFDFKQTYLDALLAQNILSDAKSLHQNVQRKYTSKIATSTDVHRSELMLLLREEELIAKDVRYKSQQQMIMSVAGLDETLNPNTQKNYYQLMEQNQKEKSIEQLQLLQMVTLKELQAIEQVTLKDRHDDPSLSLVAGYNKDNSRRFATTVDRDETVVGLKLDIPFGDGQAQAEAGLAKIESFKASLNKRKTMIDLQEKRKRSYEEVKQLKARLELAQKKVLIMEKIQKEDERRYLIGKIDLERLIEIKNDFAKYRYELQAQELAYSKALVQWYVLNDQLIDFVGVL
jgi:outer membrane protein TolC